VAERVEADMLVTTSSLTGLLQAGSAHELVAVSERGAAPQCASTPMHAADQQVGSWQGASECTS
jgi:hypothetical protein